MIGIEFFRDEAKNIHTHFPDLIYSEQEGVPCVEGKLILKDDAGNYIDHYMIRILPVNIYPFGFPFVFETAGRIPINFDWHIFEQDGHCCIKAQPEEIITCKKGITLLSFIEDEVKPYFFNQKHKETHGYFLKERSHGDAGNIESLKEIFKTQNLNIILAGLARMRKRNIPSRVEMCFCGSGLKYRKCHKDTFQMLNSFTDQQLDHFGTMVMSYMLQH